MKKIVRLAIITCIVVTACLVSLLVILHDLKSDVGTSPPIPALGLELLTKEDNNYTLRIAMINFNVQPNTVKWCINTKDGYYIASGDFPTTSGPPGAVSGNKTTVTWFDGDGNNKLSVNDTIKVYREENTLD